MQQFSKLILILAAMFCLLPSYAAINGNIKYTIPIEYSALNENELSAKADSYYNTILNTNKTKLDEDFTSALNLYSILSNKNPENIEYTLRLGKLYDILGKDRYAKSNYCKAIGINTAAPEPYFYMGEFYYKRQNYRRALKYYKEAANRGYSNHPATVLKLKEIYLKLGDKEGLKSI